MMGSKMRDVESDDERRVRIHPLSLNKDDAKGYANLEEPSTIGMSRTKGHWFSFSRM
jgi:hypothetical protein